MQFGDHNKSQANNAHRRNLALGYNKGSVIVRH